MRQIIAALFALCSAEKEAQRADAKAPTAEPLQPASENRILKRHRTPLSATVSFGFSGVPEQVEIRDINEKGLYFYTRLHMPVGATFDLLVLLPAEITPDGRQRRVHYEAKVVRAEHAGAELTNGIAASIKHCEVLPLPTDERGVSTPDQKESGFSRVFKRELPLSADNPLADSGTSLEVASKDNS
jgi:hypothetical protein